MISHPSSRASDVLRDLNDVFRADGPSGDGRWIITIGVFSLEPALVSRINSAVRTFDRFDADNDPYGERDFGSFSVRGYLSDKGQLTLTLRLTAAGSVQSCRCSTFGPPFVD